MTGRSARQKRFSAGLRPAPGGPSLATIALLGYAAVFILRPWEYKPEFAVFPWERACAILMILVVLLVGRIGNGWSIVSGSMTVFLSSLLLATLLSLDPARSWHTTANTLKTALFGYCLAWGILSARDLLLFLRGWVAILFVYQAKSLWEHLVNGRGVYRMGIWRLVGIDDTYSDPNTFAATTLFMLPFTWELLQLSRKLRWKVFFLLHLALSVVVVLKTGSRGGLIALLLFAGWAVFRSRRRSRTLVVMLIAGSVIVATLSAQLVMRYETILHPELNRSATESAEGRIAGLKRGYALFLRRPLTGIGPGCFTVADEFYSRLPGIPGLQAHNLLGQALGETGLAGLLSFLVFLGALLARAISLARRYRAGPRRLIGATAWAVTGCVLLLLLLGMVGHNLYRYTWFWIAGILEAAGALDRRGNDDTVIHRQRRRWPRRRGVS